MADDPNPFAGSEVEMPAEDLLKDTEVAISYVETTKKLFLSEEKKNWVRQVLSNAGLKVKEVEKTANTLFRLFDSEI